MRVLVKGASVSARGADGRVIKRGEDYTLVVMKDTMFAVAETGGRFEQVIQASEVGKLTVEQGRIKWLDTELQV